MEIFIIALIVSIIIVLFKLNKNKTKVNELNKLLHGEIKTIEQNGDIIIKNYVNGVENGEWKHLYSDENNFKTLNYKNGKLDGVYKEYWRNGVIYQTKKFNFRKFILPSLHIGF